MDSPSLVSRTMAIESDLGAAAPRPQMKRQKIMLLKLVAMVVAMPAAT